MFKKGMACVASVLVLLMCLLTVSVSAAPEDTVTFSLSVSEGSVGDTVTVSLSISENSRFTNAMMYLHYNPEAVSYVADSLAAGAASPKSGTMFDALAHPDKYFVKCAYITGSVVTKGGVLLTFDFEVLSDVPAAFSVSFDECQGEAEDGTMYELNKQSVGCVLNNDGTVSDPTGEPVYTTTTVTPAESTTATELTTTEASQTKPASTTTMPTMIVTDEGNNEIVIPVVTQTDAAGNVTTVPVVVVTNAQGTTVTVPVVVVTDSQGSVATIPVSEGTDANGNNVTIPVAIVTDADGNIETVPVATSTDAHGNIVTVPLTTVVGDLEGVEVPDESGSPWVVIILIAVGVAVAVGIAIAATNARKKNDDQ